jgi:hypothetical protein
MSKSIPKLSSFDGFCGFPQSGLEALNKPRVLGPEMGITLQHATIKDIPESLNFETLLPEFTVSQPLLVLVAVTQCVFQVLIFID